MPNPNPHQSISVYNATEATNAALGLGGPVIVNDTSAHSDGYICLQVVADCTFTSLTITDSTGTWTGITFSKGLTIFGRITSFTLATGTVIAYKSLIPAA